MNKFIFAIVALLTISQAIAKPNYGIGPVIPAYRAAVPAPIGIPAPSAYAAPAAAPSAYGKPAAAYSVAPAVQLRPININPNSITAPAAPSPLLPAAANPSAAASAASQTVPLRPGTYSQWVVPSWSVLDAVVDIAPAHGSYAAPAAPVSAPAAY